MAILFERKQEEEIVKETEKVEEKKVEKEETDEKSESKEGWQTKKEDDIKLKEGQENQEKVIITL